MSSLIVEVCEVKNVEHHPHADRLDVAKVKGWDCIVGRDEYVPGDLVIFVPPDSILPQEVIDRWEVSYLKSKIGRVGVVKLRGIHSYGLVLTNKDNHPKGKDVADVYGITKWLPPSERTSKGAKGRRGDKWNRKANPRFRKYTKIEHYRNYDEVLEHGEEVVITEKIHGTNFRAGWVTKEVGPVTRLIRKLLGKGLAYEFVVGSHNVQIDDPNQKTYFGQNVYHVVAAQEGLRKLPKGYVVYGEIFGPGIQDLTYGRDGLDVRYFDVMHEGHYLNFAELCNFAQEYDLTLVPILGIFDWKPEILEELPFDRPSLTDDDTIKEGVVIKPVKERTHPRLGRVILKIINPDYLVRKEGTENK
jgi:RNA ligase (TIGR02306 family)